MLYDINKGNHEYTPITTEHMHVLCEVVCEEIIDTLYKEGITRAILYTPDGREKEKVLSNNIDLVSCLSAKGLIKETTPSEADTYSLYVNYATSNLRIEELVCSKEGIKKDMEFIFLSILKSIMATETSDTLKLLLNNAKKVTYTKLTSKYLSSLIQYFGRKNPTISPTTIIMSYDVWEYIIGDFDLFPHYKESEDSEQILCGRVGRIFGLNIIIEGPQYKDLHILEPGSLFILPASKSIGACIQRSKPTYTFSELNSLITFEQKQTQFVYNNVTPIYASREV